MSTTFLHIPCIRRSYPCSRLDVHNIRHPPLPFRSPTVRDQIRSRTSAEGRPTNTPRATSRSHLDSIPLMDAFGFGITRTVTEAHGPRNLSLLLHSLSYHEANGSPVQALLCTSQGQAPKRRPALFLLIDPHSETAL